MRFNVADFLAEARAMTLVGKPDEKTLVLIGDLIESAAKELIIGKDVYRDKLAEKLRVMKESGDIVWNKKLEKVK